MVMRKIIEIDESSCNGCGQCITACAEGAIELKNGKARVISDSFCDGLGACLNVCPEGALTIKEREAKEFNEQACQGHKKHPKGDAGRSSISPCTSPVSLKQGTGTSELKENAIKSELSSSNQLANWPIQMRLVRPWAPYLKGASLLIAADCTGFAYSDIQRDFIKGRVTLVGCPKLDEKDLFTEKLVQILQANEIRDITVLHMTVPCCSNLEGMVSDAVLRSGKKVPLKSFVVGIDGCLTA
jgi:Pyruvate/2-oxoacid:ferredoxin oxidoreductase delta subunit